MAAEANNTWRLRADSAHIPRLVPSHVPNVDLSHDDVERHAEHLGKNKGMGLELIEKIISHHHGNFEICDSTYGALFKVKLPLYTKSSSLIFEH